MRVLVFFAGLFSLVALFIGISLGIVGTTSRSGNQEGGDVAEYVLLGRAYAREGFTSLEQAHLDDVRGIANAFQISGLIAIVLAVIALSFLSFQDRGRALVLTGVGLIVVVGALGIWAFVDFDSFFTKFHLLFFSGNWQFPSTSLLITLFPESFFHMMIQKIVVGIITVGVVLAGLGLIVQRGRACPVSRAM